MFATYNIQNAAHNYCDSGEILLFLDGDDELIGPSTFKLINSMYQQPNQEFWIVYTNFITSKFTVGKSHSLTKDFYESPRRELYIFGAMRTVLVDLYRKIDDKDHRDSRGNYWKIAYDLAMQCPLLEMAGIERVHYIPELVYFYNYHSLNDGG